MLSRLLADMLIAFVRAVASTYLTSEVSVTFAAALSSKIKTDGLVMFTVDKDAAPLSVILSSPTVTIISEPLAAVS